MWSRRLLKIALVAAGFSFTGAVRGAEPNQPAPGVLCTPPATQTCEELVALGYAYPYAREPGSYLCVNGVDLSGGLLSHGSVQVGSKVVATATLLQTLGYADRITRRYIPVIGYGSNVTVSALTRKYTAATVKEHAVIPVTRAVLHDYDVVWSPHLVFNGAMPATIVPSRGTADEVWINWLDGAALQRMNETEGAGVIYSYGALTRVRLDLEAPLSEPPHVYVDCYGALALNGLLQAISTIPARGRRFPAADSEHAMRSVASRIGWTDSVFALLLDNVRSPERRAARTLALSSLGRFLDDPRYQPQCPCGAGPCPIP